MSQTTETGIFFRLTGFVLWRNFNLLFIYFSRSINEGKSMLMFVLDSNKSQVIVFFYD